MIASGGCVGAGLRRPDAFTKLHLRFDGESNTFYDLCGNTITVHGDVTQTTTQRRFIGKSGYGDGDGDYIEMPVSGFPFSGDSTIACWIYPTVFSVTGQLFGSSNPSSPYNGWYIYCANANKKPILYIDNSAKITSTTAFTINEWNYFKIFRSGSTITMHLNGASVGSATAQYTDASQNLKLWISNTSGAYYTAGYIDEFIIKTIADSATGVPTRRK